MATCRFEYWPSIEVVGSSGGIEGIATVTYAITSTPTSWTIMISQLAIQNKRGMQSTFSYTIKVGGTTLKSGSVTIGKNQSSTISVSASKTVTLTHTPQYVKLELVGGNGDFIEGGETFVLAKQSYDVTFDANGGTGAPPTQTKWYDESLTISTAKPTRTGYVFRRWNTSTSDSGTAYNPGASYTTNAALALHAIWNPVISYNANGGTGAPSSQTKTYGTSITLSTVEPTRAGYKFNGWNTKADGSGTNYAKGATYTSNTALALYAKWLKEPALPTVSSFSVVRCDSTGTADDAGVYCKVVVGWSVDTTSDTKPNNYGTVTGTVSVYGSSTTSLITWRSGAGGSGITSGTAIAILSGISTDNQYLILITVSDQKPQSVSRADICTRAKFLFDFRAGGEGIGIGCAAPQSGLEIAMETTHTNHLRVRSKNLYLKTMELDRDGTIPSSTTYASNGRLYFHDQDSETLGTLYPQINAFGVNQMVLMASSDAGTNYLIVGVDRSGNKSYAVADAAAFRAAIAAVNKAGDSMTGDLTTSGALRVNGATIDRDGTAPSSAVYEDTHAVDLLDKDGETVGKLRIYETQAGTTGVSLVAFNEPTGGGTAVYNVFNVQVAKDGTRSYGMSDPAAFRTAISAAAASHSHSNYAASDHTHTPASIGAAAASHSHSELTRSNTNITDENDAGGLVISVLSSGSIRLVRNGLIATVFINSAVINQTSLANGGSYRVGTVPSGYRPAYTAYAMCAMNYNGFPKGVYAYVNTSGAVYVINRSGAALDTSSHAFLATITYVI